jgi:hypothetical protein
MSFLKEVLAYAPSTQEVYYDLDGRMCFETVNYVVHMGWVVVEEGEGFARPASIYKSLCSAEQVIEDVVDFDAIECF